MAGWTEFAAAAPRIAEIFVRRHTATGNLCMLGTLRPDGFPRLSPMEPRFSGGELWIFGMPGTAKFADLARDPRFSLHTASADPKVTEGDAKIWGTVIDVGAVEVHERLAQELFDQTGFDIRGGSFDHCFQVDVTGASSVEVLEDHLDITTWRTGGEQKVIQKH